MNTRTLLNMAKKVADAAAISKSYETIATALQQVDQARQANMSDQIHAAVGRIEAVASKFDMRDMSPAERLAYQTIDPGGMTGPKGLAWLNKVLLRYVGNPGGASQTIQNRIGELNLVFQLAKNMQEALKNSPIHVENGPVLTLWLAGEGTPKDLLSLKEHLDDWLFVFRAFGRLTGEDANAKLVEVEEGSIGLGLIFKGIMVINAVLGSINAAMSIQKIVRERRAGLRQGFSDSTPLALKQAADETVAAAAQKEIDEEVERVMQSYPDAESDPEIRLEVSRAMTIVNRKVGQGHHLVLRGAEGNDELLKYQEALDRAVRELNEIPAVSLLSLPAAPDELRANVPDGQ